MEYEDMKELFLREEVSGEQFAEIFNLPFPYLSEQDKESVSSELLEGFERVFYGVAYSTIEAVAFKMMGSKSRDEFNSSGKLKLCFWASLRKWLLNYFEFAINDLGSDVNKLAVLSSLSAFMSDLHANAHFWDFYGSANFTDESFLCIIKYLNLVRRGIIQMEASNRDYPFQISALVDSVYFTDQVLSELYPNELNEIRKNFAKLELSETLVLIEAKTLGLGEISLETAKAVLGY